MAEKNALVCIGCRGAVADRKTRRIWLVFYWGLGVVPLAVTPFWPRSFDVWAYKEALAQAFGTSRIVGQMASLFTLLLSATLIFHTIVREKKIPRRRLPLMLAWAFLAAGPLISMLLGIVPRFSLAHVAGLLAILVPILLPSVDPCWMSVVIKRILQVYVWGSLLSAVLIPSWAVENPYTQGYIPGISVRLHGLTVHANHTAPFAWLLFLLEITFPSRRSWLNLVAAIFVLVLTQSKTMWALLLIAIGLMCVLSVTRQRSAFARIVMFFVIILGGWAALMVSESVGSAGLGTYQSENLSTLTGRTRIWQVVLELYRKNPWFGYGLDLWSPEMSLEFQNYLGWTPAQAHNQYIQSLGESGIVGLVGLAIYLMVLIGLGWQTRNLFKGVGFILPMMWALRGITESWFRRSTTDGNLFIHACIVALIVLVGDLAWKEQRKEQGG